MATRSEGVRFRTVTIVWDFVDSPDTTSVPFARFFSRYYVPPTGPKPGDSYAFVGAIPNADKGSSLDMKKGSLTIGGSSFLIADEDGKVSSFIANNVLKGKYIIRRVMFDDETWEEAHVTSWVLSAYRTGGKMGKLFQFDLENTLAMMLRKPLFSNYHRDWSTVGLNEDQYDKLPNGDQKIRLERSIAQDWREAAWAMLFDQKEGVIEIVRYTDTSGEWLDPVDRHVAGFGITQGASGNMVGIDFPAKRTVVYPGYFERANPVDLAMRWFTRTEDGSNGDWDDGAVDDTPNRDGLGIPSGLFDTDRIVSVRDEYCEQPTWGGPGNHHVADGVAVGVFLTQDISDLKAFVEKKLLLPYGLVPVLTGYEKWAIAPINPESPDVTDIDNNWIRPTRPKEWKRSYRAQVNTAVATAMMGPDGATWSERTYADDTYPPGGKIDLQAAGGWVGAYAENSKLPPGGGGWDPPGGDPDPDGLGPGPHANPNYQTDRRIRDLGVNPYFGLFAYPQTKTEIKVPFDYFEVSLGDRVRARLPWVLDETTGEYGQPETFVVIRRKVDWLRGYITLGLLSARTY